jgi:predicted RNase H-like HicB family nuclease
MKYLVVFERSADGSIWARVPDLDGCYSTGNTIEDARERVKEAIELYLEDLKDDGKPAPTPSYLKAEMIEVAA